MAVTGVTPMLVRDFFVQRRRRSLAGHALPLITAGFLLGAAQIASANEPGQRIERLVSPPRPALALVDQRAVGALARTFAGLAPLSRRLDPAPLAPYLVASTGTVQEGSYTPVWPEIAPVTGGGGRSGLPWSSGAACGGSNFEAFRGKQQDVQVLFAPFDTFDNMLYYFTNNNPAKVAKNGIPISIGLGLLTEETRGQLANCAAGAFDSYFMQIGAALVKQGAGQASIRLGWEANGITFPWVIGTNPYKFRDCFRRAANALHSTAPKLKIAWHNARKGKLEISNTTSYPGDFYVNDVALSFYDRTLVNADQDVWDSNYELTKNGGPAGLASWLAFARSRNKKLTLGEWAIAKGSYDGFDNPFFIQKMYEFFKANASSIYYESYFNCPQGGSPHYVYPDDGNPSSSAMYESLYKTGNPPARF